MKKNNAPKKLTSVEKLALPSDEVSPEPSLQKSASTEKADHQEEHHDPDVGEGMTIFQAIRSGVESFIDHDCLTMAAATSYYILFSLPSILLLLFRGTGAMIDAKTLTAKIRDQLTIAVGESVTEQVIFLIEGLSEPSQSSIGASIIGILTLIFGATGGFAKLQETLNRVWNVKTDPEVNSIRSFFAKRLLSFLMVGAMFALAFTSVLLTSVVGIISETLKPILPAGFNSVLVVSANFTITFFVLGGLFAAMFKILPDVKLAWRDVWLGSLITASLFMAGQLAIGLYIGFGDVGSGFGAASSMAVLLVWMYYSLVIIFLGAELTRAFVTRAGRDVLPSEGAVLIQPNADLEPNAELHAHKRETRPDASPTL